MSRPRPIAYRGIGAFALISLFTLTVVAQQSKQSDTTMFLMVRAGPTLGEAQILSTLKKGLKESKCTITGEPNPCSSATKFE